MSSSGNKYSVSVINDHNPTTSLRHNMASSGSYSTGSGSSYPGSTSSRDSSPNVHREVYRSPTSVDYRVDAVTRTSGQKEVKVLNYHSRGYNSNDPHPEYSSRHESKRQQRS